MDSGILTAWETAGNDHLRQGRVTLAATRSRSQAMPLGGSGALAILAAEADIARAIAEGDAGYHEEQLRVDTNTLETSQTYAQAHSGPHSGSWADAMHKELIGLVAFSTFVLARGK